MIPLRLSLNPVSLRGEYINGLPFITEIRYRFLR